MHEFFHPKCCLLSWYPVDNHPKYSNSSMAAIERFSLQLRFLLVFAFLNSHHALNPESNRESLACRRSPFFLYLSIRCKFNILQFSNRQGYSLSFLFSETFRRSRGWTLSFEETKPTDSEDLRAGFLMLYHVSYLAVCN